VAELAHGQLLPNSNQAYQFASSYNPAFSGIESSTSIRLGYRSQWTGFGNEGPTFATLLFDVRLKQPLDLKHNAWRTSQSGADAEEIPKRKLIIHGFGACVLNEKVSVIDRIGGNMNYSFHYPISKKIRLATGVSVAIENTKLNVGELYLGVDPDPDSFYDFLLTNGVSQTNLNVRAGLLLYSPRFYIGFSYNDLIYSALTESGVDFNELYYRGSAQAGITIPLSAAIDLKPSTFLSWQIDDSWLIDYYLKLEIQRKFTLGFAYRTSESFVTLVSFNLNHAIGVSYTYEQSTNSLKQFSDGSHEIVLGLRLNNSRRKSEAVW
jgi:type IX secretion system PorP/SprF family membrane protein